MCVVCVCVSVERVFFNITLSHCLVQYTMERLINQMTARPGILVNQ